MRKEKPEAKKAKLKKALRMPRRRSLFWDVDPKKIDPKKHERYVIPRIINFGNEREMKWMFDRYEHSLIRGVLYDAPDLFHKARAFWKLVIESEEEMWPWHKLLGNFLRKRLGLKWKL